MAEISTVHIALIAGSVAAGVVAGWLVRGSRCTKEKVAVGEGWQLQLEAQRSEQSRLLEQNKGLMEQVSQLHASGKDATNRARELSGALKEAFERRDEIQRELMKVGSDLEIAIRERDQLKSDIGDAAARDDSVQSKLARKDDKIFRLNQELENWQNRLPPLLDRYRERNEEAACLEEKLRAANDRLAELENRRDADEMHIEPSSPETLGDELDASNDPDAPGQVRPIDAESDEPDEELSVSDVVDEVHDQAAESVEDDEGTFEAPEGVAEGEADEATSIADHLINEDFGGDEFDEAFDDDAPASAEADDFMEDETESGEAEFDEEAESIAIETVAGEGAVDDWSSATSAEIAGLADQDPDAGRDNLKLIKGIGPAIEKTLNELGIFRFDQIAEMSEYDIDRIARRLRGFRSRIYREDWIGQARDLQFQKTAS
jgi:predicted flap endonuclease-1-like 5' DNA nuclease